MSLCRHLVKLNILIVKLFRFVCLTECRLHMQVSEREDRLFMDDIEKLKIANEEVDGDEDSEEDTGMGDVDLTKTGVGSQ